MLHPEESLNILKKHVPSFPEALVVLGSGWNRVLEGIKCETEIGYGELFGVQATVPGHEGRLIVATVAGKRTAFMSGRFHLYEGYSAFEATAPFRLFAQAGMKTLILTAASGGLNETYRVGDVVILNDMITLLLAIDNPLVGPRFIDTSRVFDEPLRKACVDICRKNNIPFREGSYIYYHGPNFETPSDKRAMKTLGADVCGMSTVPETLVARSLGVRVLALAFVTNLAFVKHDHEEVLREAQKGGERMGLLLRGIISSL
jgi:purine-nucleoside phosphorylase